VNLGISAYSSQEGLEGGSEGEISLLERETRKPKKGKLLYQKGLRDQTTEKKDGNDLKKKQNHMQQGGRFL